MPTVQDAKEVVDRGSARARHHRHPAGQERELPLAPRLEEALLLQALLELLERDLQRARAERLDSVADQLVTPLWLVDRQPSAGHEREPVLDGESQPPRLRAEEHGIDAGVGVLEREVEVTAGGRAQIRDLALHQHGGKAPFENGLQLAGQLGDGVDARTVGSPAEEIELAGGRGRFRRQPLRHYRGLLASSRSSQRVAFPASSSPSGRAAATRVNPARAASGSSSFAT